MSFARPDMLGLALLVPAVLALAVWLYARRRRRIADLFSDAHLLHRLGGQSLRRFPVERMVLVTLAGLCLGLAAAGPRWGLRAAEGRPLALNVVLAMDISRSMLAEDMEPNRLERARLFSRRLLRELPGDRFGLVVFAGRSYTLSPLTVDHSAVELYIDALDPDMVSMGGSSLSDALRQATDLVRGEQMERGDRIVVMLSDFEALEELEEVRAATERAARAGVRVINVGFGTPRGSTIPVVDAGTGGVTGVRRDEYGEVVVSQLDEGLMRDIASRTGGAAVRADDGAALGRVLSDLRGMQRGAGDSATRMEPRERAALLAGLALLCLLLDTLIARNALVGTRRTPGAQAEGPEPAVAAAAAADAAGQSPARRSAGRAAAVVLMTTVLFGFGPGDLERGNRMYREGRYEEAVDAYRRVVESGRSSPEVHYNLGTALLAMGAYQEAEQHLQAALQAVEPDVRNRTFYNLGNRFLAEGRAQQDLQRQGQLLDAAIEAYRRALRIAPGDVDAKWNLEMALRDRAENEQQQQDQPDQQDPQEGDDGQDDSEQDDSQGGASGSTGQAPSGAARDQETDQQPMSQEQAEQILNAVEQDERELTRERLRRGQRTVPVLRDW
ncbi:MAG TPA: VWA domain-containing protein [Longimicrobiales bacterium]|nr:VWA domain-containing protein [Longimicrobiales bacterium]